MSEVAGSSEPNCLGCKDTGWIQTGTPGERVPCDCTVARTSKDGVAAAIGVIDTSHRRGRDEILAAAVVLANALRAGFETLASPLCDGEVRVIYEHGEPHGVRDVSGYLCHFNRVPKFEGQEERYRRELALRARQAEAIATALRGTQAAVEAITDIKNAEIKRLQDLLMTRSSVPVEEICTPRVALKAAVLPTEICPTDDDYPHKAHEGKCMYCGAPMNGSEGTNS